MYFPWYGHIEMIKYCDTYVFFDDAQFKKNYYHRVQLNNKGKQLFITIPLQKHHKFKNLNDIYPSRNTDWRKEHISKFRNLYMKAPFFEMALKTLEDTLSFEDYPSLPIISENSTKSLVNFFGIKDIKFLRSSDLKCTGKSTEKLINICKDIGADIYVTAHGAKNYLDHKRFEKEGINVEYMEYGLKSYKQFNNENFLPFVSSLDCIANNGIDSINYLTPKTTPWYEII